MNYIKDESFDEERALYNQHSLTIERVRIDGEKDGESAIKECSDIYAYDCYFNLRYPWWHVNGAHLKNCEMTPSCRAALWYCKDVDIVDSKLHGIKALRECKNVSISGCDIISQEFGWSVDNIAMNESKVVSEYFMMRSSNIAFEKVDFSGKYSFQYIKNAVFENCRFDTKDAFWHGENILVKDSVVKGEYLAWYSKNLTFVNCTIIGTQPLCYCDNLNLVDCKMIDCDLSFERSNVNATIIGEVDSIKNVASGVVTVDGVKEIIRDDDCYKGQIIIR